MKKFKGFTLSEVLIAITVVGILIAIITPAIVKNKPNSKKMLIKKSYYTAESIVSSLINDERFYPDKTDECYTTPIGEDCYWGFDDTSEVKFEGNDYSGNTKFINLFKAKLNLKSENGKIFVTSDGIEWDLTNATWAKADSVGNFDTSNKNTITIDVNGNEGPNLSCTDENEDCDRYGIQILANGKMRINPTYTRAIDYTSIKNAGTDYD